MKRNRIFIFVLLLISLCMTINCTHAYFNSRKKLETINITRNHNITLNANGGYFNRNNNVKVVNNQITLPLPNRTGYTFRNYSFNSNGTNSIDRTINVDSIENKTIYANWSVNQYNVDVNPVIDGTQYNSGLSGYTFNVYINNQLVANSVTDWCQNVDYGSSVRVVANAGTGTNTSYDQTMIVGTSSLEFKPSWSKKYFNVNYYVNGNYFTTNSVEYGNSVPSHSYTLNPWEVWDGWNNIPSQMPSWDIRVDGYYHEANCYVWAGHPKAQSGYAVMTNVVNAAKHEFTGVVGPYEGTNINGVPLWIMNTDSSLKYSQVMAKLPTSMSRYTWWSYAEIHCDNGYAVAYTK